MTEISNNRPHISFCILGALALIWNLMGVINFFGQMNPEIVASMPEPQQIIINERPIWGTIAFGLAVIGGAIGCILLLLRKSIAQVAFVISLLGIMIQLAPNFKLAGEVKMTPVGIFLILLLPLLVAAFLAWYASQTQNKGWIN